MFGSSLPLSALRRDYGRSAVDLLNLFGNLLDVGWGEDNLPSGSSAQGSSHRGVVPSGISWSFTSSCAYRKQIMEDTLRCLSKSFWLTSFASSCACRRGSSSKGWPSRSRSFSYLSPRLT